MSDEEKRTILLAAIIASVSVTWVTIWAFILFIKYGAPLLINLLP